MESDSIKYNEMVKKINAMSDEDLDKLLKEDECPFQPELIPKQVPIGMHHCPVCGEMVVAGIPHPRETRICPCCNGKRAIFKCDTSIVCGRCGGSGKISSLENI